MADVAILVPLGFFITVIALALGVPFVRALGRKWDRQGLTGGATPELAQRLQRMEQTLDAMAIEVERISENQRFTTRLLAERGADALPAGTGTGDAAHANRRTP